MDFKPICELERGDGARAEDFESHFEGCSCNGPCNAEYKCSCLSSSGRDVYDDCKYIKEDAVDLPIIECSSNCSCSLNQKLCMNRCVQCGVTLPLEVFKTPNKGFGVRCSESIRKSRFVAEYIGEVIGSPEVKRRSPHTVYALAVTEKFHNRNQTTYIDAERKGNIARFINHSCDPNLEMVIVRIGTSCVHVGLFARRSIAAYEELSYDYDINHLSDDSSCSRKRCHCESPNCRIYLPASISPTS